MLGATNSRIECASEKSRICAAIIELLPDWFGIPESNSRYVREIADKEVWGAWLDDAPVGAVARATRAERMIVSTVSARSPDPFYARTRRFYGKMGFVPPFEQSETGPGEPMVWMFKPLASGGADE